MTENRGASDPSPTPHQSVQLDSGLTIDGDESALLLLCLCLTSSFGENPSARRIEAVKECLNEVCPLPSEREALEAPGPTHLNPQQTEQIGMIPPGIELFAADTALLCFLALE